MPHHFSKSRNPLHDLPEHRGVESRFGMSSGCGYEDYWINCVNNTILIEIKHPPLNVCRSADGLVCPQYSWARQMRVRNIELLPGYDRIHLYCEIVSPLCYLAQD
jgi:hypothetical protein